MSKADIKILTNRKQYLKWPFGLSFKRENYFRNEAIAIEKDKCRTNFNRTIYIGTSILDQSKILMQDFHKYIYIGTSISD